MGEELDDYRRPMHPQAHSPQRSDPGDWDMAFDPESGQSYYYSQRQNRSTWSPKQLVPRASSNNWMGDSSQAAMDSRARYGPNRTSIEHGDAEEFEEQNLEPDRRLLDLKAQLDADLENLNRGHETARSTVSMRSRRELHAQLKEQIRLMGDSESDDDLSDA